MDARPPTLPRYARAPDCSDREERAMTVSRRCMACGNSLHPCSQVPNQHYCSLLHASASAAAAGNGSTCATIPTIAKTRHGRMRAGAPGIRTTGASIERRIRRTASEIASCNKSETPGHEQLTHRWVSIRWKSTSTPDRAPKHSNTTRGMVVHNMLLLSRGAA